MAGKGKPDGFVAPTDAEGAAMPEDVGTALESTPPPEFVATTPEWARDAVDPRRPPLPKPVGQWATTTVYDPEAASKSRAQDFVVDAPTYAKRFGVLAADVGRDFTGYKDDDPIVEKMAVTVPGMPGKFVANEVEGVFMAYVPESHRFKPIRIKNKSELHEFNVSEYGRQKRMVESGGFGIDPFGDEPMGGGGQDSTRLIDTEFVPLMSGPFFKQLYIYDYLLMHSRAFEMVNHNALAAAAIKIMQRFTVGRGINYDIKDDACKQVFDEFWQRNNMREVFRQMARDLPWQGELMVRFYEHSRGKTGVRILDPSTCWEIVTDPEDFAQVYYYHFQWPTPYQIWVSGQIPVAKYIIQEVPPTNILHLKINVSSQEKRGRSDLLPAMPWLKRFNDFYNGQTVKAVLEANLVFKIKIKGDQVDVQNFLTNAALTELPPPGGTWVENEAVDLQPISAQLTAGRGSQGIGQQIAAIVAASLNLPNEYFNIEAGTGAARATALVRTDPAVKTIEDRQQLLKELGEGIYDRVIADAILAGRLDKSKARRDPDVAVGKGGDYGPDPSSRNGRPTQRASLVRTRG